VPYNPGGLFSLVASYFATPGASIRTEQHNPVFEDVAAALSSVYLRDGRAPMTGDVNMNGFSITNVVAGNSLSSVATLAQSMPIGAVIDFAGTSPPPGWMLCYGQALNRTTYATLFAWLGTTYGVGDGSTTFNLPDLRGRVIAAPDAMGGAAANRLTPSYFGSTAQGAAGGADNQTLTLAQTPQGINSAGVNSIVVTSGTSRFP
jgi:microcystin-dependent protein